MISRTSPLRHTGQAIAGALAGQAGSRSRAVSPKLAAVLAQWPGGTARCTLHTALHQERAKDAGSVPNGPKA